MQKKKVPSSTSKSKVSSGASALETMLTRPQYIVVFREPSERNVELMSKVLGVGEDRGVQARAGRVVLAAKGGDRARTRVYQRLSIAVTDLDPDQIRAVHDDERVDFIVPNEIRTIPPIFDDERGESAVVRSQVTPTGSPANLIAYLQGQRDALDGVLRALGVQGIAPAMMPMLGTAPATASWQRSSDSGHSWCLDMIGLGMAQPRYTGAGVAVAVLDTGIDLDHPDFHDRFADGAHTQSFVSGESVQDGNGHGTHCAGVIAGPRSPAGGRRFGVAPDVELFVGKVLSDEGSGSDDQILDAIDWAADQGVRVISMSLGSVRQSHQPYARAYERVAKTLLEKQNVLIVAAAGNESNRPYWTAPVGNPAACPSILAVAAIDRDRQIAYFSSRQMDDIGEVNIAAPGVGVYSSWKGGGYRTISGTSMATPHVAGVAALLVEQEQSSGQALWRRLVQGAAHLDLDVRDVGSGLVQAPAAASAPIGAQRPADASRSAARGSRVAETAM